MFRSGRSRRAGKSLPAFILHHHWPACSISYMALFCAAVVSTLIPFSVPRRPHFRLKYDRVHSESSTVHPIRSIRRINDMDDGGEEASALLVVHYKIPFHFIRVSAPPRHSKPAAVPSSHPFHPFNATSQRTRALAYNWDGRNGNTDRSQ